MRVPFVPNTLILLSVLGLLLLAAMLHAGYVRSTFLPTPPLNVTTSTGLLGWRIEALRYDQAACQKAMAHPNIVKTHLKDRKIQNGCGWQNALSLKRVGAAKLGGVRLSCPMAAGVSLWLNQIVQPAAQKHFGKKVTRLIHYGTYACRNIKGSLFSKYLNMRSEHATANAIDIGGFVLSNGQTISVLKHWQGTGPKAKFLHEVNKGACSYFRVVLGPEANRLHKDHFHFDRGLLLRCS